MQTHDIIVIGASAGGVEALRTLVSELPADIKAAVFIVLHVARQGTSVLPDILSQAGPLPACHPQSGDLIEHGKIYAAPNDRHLIIQGRRVVLTNAPRENGFRPAVDSLFRTAAKAYGPRVVGVVLTGLLDNGSAGLLEVKSKGGVAVVQDPADAMFPDMPRNAINAVDVDYILPLSQIPATLVKLSMIEVSQQGTEGGHNPSGTGQPKNTETIYSREAGTISDLVCPECGGVMVEYRSEEDGSLVSFVCRVGHRYSLRSMTAHQDDTTEGALWAAVRALEESRSIAQRMQQYAHESGDLASSERYAKRAEEAQHHADVIRQLLLGPSS